MNNRQVRLIAVSLLLFGLAGCASTTPSSAPDAPGPTPSEAAVELSGSPTAFTCESLLPDYNISPDPHGWVLDDSFEPTPGTAAQRAADIGGIACGFTGTAGEQLVVSFAEPTEQTYSALIDEISLSSEPTDELRISPAFFRDGTVDVLPAGYWASLSSPVFTAPSDAVYLVNAIDQALPKY